MITKIKLYKIFEKRITLQDAEDSDSYLLIKDTGNNIEFVITSKTTIYAYAEILKKEDHYIFYNTFAQDKWGPMMHDAVLMHFYPHYIVPSSSLTDEENAIWSYYYTSRKDAIIKDKGNHTDSLYSLRPTYDFLVWKKKSEVFLEEMTKRLPTYLDVRIRAGKRAFADIYQDAL